MSHSLHYQVSQYETIGMSDMSDAFQNFCILVMASGLLSYGMAVFQLL